MATHSVMQKIRIIGFFFENNLHWQFEEEKNLFTAILDDIFIYIKIKLINNSLYLYYKGGGGIKP
jgi:hypothetical protein